MCCLGILVSQNVKLSRFLSVWLGTSPNLHPLLLHLLHLTMCCFADNSSLPQSLHWQFPLSNNLLVSPFRCVFHSFSSLAFLQSLYCFYERSPWHMPMMFLNFASSPVTASFLSLFFHPHTQKSISTDYPLHLQGGQSCSFERKIVEEFKLQRGSHSVGSIWTENVGVTYRSLKWMLPPVDSWITQTLQNTFHFKPVKCLLCPLWKKINGINKSKGGQLLFQLSLLLANKALEKSKGLCSQSGTFK